jgi:hypothetical protein
MKPAKRLCTFRSAYKGMGKFIMMPQEGKQYFALVEEFPDFQLSV